jgi:phosphoglucosamine mutase
VAHLTGELDVDFGVMISASHNPMPDNGNKLFDAGGHKLPDAVEDEIEARLPGTPLRATGASIGRVHDVDDAPARYMDHLLLATPQPLAGLRLVVDCANGAASEVAPEVYRRAGAEVTPIHADPDGININEGCGSTQPAAVAAEVVARGADLGIAHDGDADRCLAVDATGTVVDGDQIMAVLALAMQEAGELTADTVVVTVMSNLGLHFAMRESGVVLRTTGVGDRYVLAELSAGGYALGGEQSGHIVLPGHATTGDGVLTALRLMSRMAATGKPLAELACVMRRLPQVLRNVRVADKASVMGTASVLDAISAVEADLGETGRVLLRASGTEQLVRVMVEAPTEEVAAAAAERLATVVSAAH